MEALQPQPYRETEASPIKVLTLRLCVLGYISAYAARVYLQCGTRVCFRLWHTACSGPDGEVFVFGGCANNLLAQQRAVRDLPNSVEHRTLCISEKL